MPVVSFHHVDGRVTTIDAPRGYSLMQLARMHDIDEIEGTCEGSLACATCHVVVDADWFPKLPPLSEDEEDMLDLATSLQPTSRLGCQIKVDDDLSGLIVHLPE